MARRIAILGGTGAEGSGLAYRWAKAGEQVLIGSRDGARAAETAKQLRERIGGAAQIEGKDNASAAAACDVAVMTVPFSGAAALLKQLKGVWKPGTVVIDTTVPLAATVGGAATRTLGVWRRRCRIWELRRSPAMDRWSVMCWCAATMRRPSRSRQNWSAKFPGRAR